jgi:hypothetical protein
MDTETQKLLALLLGQAKSGNKNISSILGNMDNPILLAMAGALDPYYGSAASGSSGGSLYNSFASDESTPAAVKAVMDYVDQGMNPYQIEAQINALDSDVIKDSGYTDQQLISMGKEMTKQGGKVANDVFKKAGLRNPNEVYTTSDVPIEGGVRDMVVEQDKKSKKILEMQANADTAVAKAQKKLSPMYGKRFDTKELIDWLKNDPSGQKIAKEKNVDWSKVDETTGQVFSGPLSDVNYDNGWQKWTPWGALGNLVGQGVAEVGRVGEIYAKENVMGGKPKYIEDKVGFRKGENPYDVYALDQAKLDQEALVNQQQKAKKLDEATRRGALRAYSESGRTPFTDQTSALLKFVAGSK